MKKTLSIFAFLLMGLGLFAQEGETAAKPKPTLDELRDSISKIVNDFFDEVLDLEVAYAAVQARQISNVGYGLDNALFQNGELRDTFEVLRQVLQSELFIKAAVHYDHFWTRLIERSNYSPRDAELEKRYGDGLYDNRIYFDVVFTPAWDTLKMDVDAAREVDSIAWECSIDLHGVGTFRAEFSDKEMARLAGQPVSGHKYGNIGTGAKPDVNMGVMGSLGWLAEKFGYSPADDTTNVRYVRFYALNANDRTFDAPGKALLGGNYDNTPVEGRKYLAPWQSAAGNAQTLYAHVERKDKKNGTGDTLAFKTTAGGPVSAERLNDTTYRLSLSGLSTMGGQGIQATYSYTGSDGREKAVFAGQVNIAENKAQKMDLVLVEVNGNTLGEPAKAVQDTLNAIYKPAGVTWTVRKEPLKVKSKAADTDNLDDGEAQVLTNYTGDMDAVIDAYRKVYGKPDKNTCYLFLVGKAQSGTGKCGYMPLKRQFGFIFTKSACGSKGELKRTVAHELGHGPFRLYHTFSAHSQYVQPEGETDNLMDYSNGTRTRKYQWDLIHDPESMIALFQYEEEGASVEEGPISEVTRFINTIKCAKNKNLETVTIHHSVNSYSVKVRDVLGQLNKYRGASPSIASDEFKKAYLNVYIDEGMFSSATDFYFGYHNFRLSVNDYERKPAQGTDSEKLIFTANGEPIIFSFPLGTDAGIQKDVLDWLERECGIESGGSPFKSINFNIGSDDIEDLFSLSTCQLEQIDKGDRKTLIGEALENVEGFLGVDKDSYQYLLASLIASTPKADVEDLVNYLSGIGDKLELAYLDLSATAREVFIESLCAIAEKSWDNTEYLGKINSYLLGVQALSKDLADKVNVGMCGVFDVSPGVYRFSRAVWLSEDGKYPYNKIKPEGAFEVSAFDPIESHIIGVDNHVDETVIYPAIVTKILATQLHIANIDHLLDIPKMVLLPEVTANIFAAVPRVGTATTNLLKGGISTTTGGLSKLLGQCGELGYKLKKAGTEIALYTNLNVEIARFSGKGKLLTEVYPSSRIGANVIVLEDEISYTSAVSKESKNGYIELARDADGNLFFKEVAGKWFEELPEGLRTDIGSLDSDLGKLFANATEAERGSLVESWKVLDDLGETALKTDINWLKRVNDWEGAGVKLSKNGDNLRLADASGNTIGEFKNGNILPERYATTGTPKGDVVNGYQVVDNNGILAIKRVPDKSAYSASELTELTQHPNAHVLERHGHDVTDDALIKRANTGKAPDGSTTASGNPPPYSSKFDSPQKVLEALDNTKPGTDAFNSGIQQGNRRIVSYTSNSGNLGKGVPKDGSTFETTNKVLAIYQDVGDGNYQLLTMYPDF